MNKNYGRNGGGDKGGKGVVVISYKIGDSVRSSYKSDLEQRRADYAAELEEALAAEQRAVTMWEEDHQHRIEVWETEHGPRGEVFVHPAYDKAIDEAFDE